MGHYINRKTMIDPDTGEILKVSFSYYTKAKDNKFILTDIYQEPIGNKGFLPHTV